MQGTDELDFAYRYPFSTEARAVIAAAKQSRIEYRYLELGRERIDGAIAYEGARRRRSLYFDIALENVKLSYVLSYVYARMLASTVADRSVMESFVAYEARRSEEALLLESAQNVVRVATEVGVAMQTNAASEFLVRFDDFLKNVSDRPEDSLVNRRLSMGYVMMGRDEVVALIGEAMRRAVRAGMPIPRNELPKEVVEFSKEVHFKVREVNAPVGGSGISWIERLIATPIPDVRHRTVNLILAPYMTNIKGMDPEQATKAIMEYIERCKLVNPDTRVSEKYVRYQCEYAKKKGMKPLKLENARELLVGLVDLGTGGRAERKSSVPPKRGGGA